MNNPIKIYCDMDGVLVNQSGRSRFDLMGWHPHGRDIWAAILKYGPALLSMCPDNILRTAWREKIIWARRELGQTVDVMVVPDSIGKSIFSMPGAYLIDDSVRHQKEWESQGGVFIHATSLSEVVKNLP